jgi:hypothetical protein
MLRVLLFLAFLPLPALADGFPDACSGTAVCSDGWLSHSGHCQGTWPLRKITLRKATLTPSRPVTHQNYWARNQPQDARKASGGDRGVTAQSTLRSPYGIPSSRLPTTLR